MPIFHVPHQKHVIFPLFKFEVIILPKWRYSVFLIRNMSFFHFSSSKLKCWPNGDIPCASSETCHFSTFRFETEILAKWQYSVCLIRNMSFIHFLNSKSKFWPNGDIPCALSETCHNSTLNFKVIILAKWRCSVFLIRNRLIFVTTINLLTWKKSVSSCKLLKSKFRPKKLEFTRVFHSTFTRTRFFLVNITNSRLDLTQTPNFYQKLNTRPHSLLDSFLKPQHFWKNSKSSVKPHFWLSSSVKTSLYSTVCCCTDRSRRRSSFFSIVFLKLDHPRQLHRISKFQHQKSTSEISHQAMESVEGLVSPAKISNVAKVSSAVARLIRNDAFSTQVLTWPNSKRSKPLHARKMLSTTVTHFLAEFAEILREVA